MLLLSRQSHSSHGFPLKCQTFSRVLRKCLAKTIVHHGGCRVRHFSEDFKATVCLCSARLHSLASRLMTCINCWVPSYLPSHWTLNASRKDSGYMQQPSPQCSPTLTNNADIYAAFAQQSADAVSQHSAYSRTDRSLAETSSVHPVAPVAAQDMSLDLAALYGNQPVVNRANLRVLQGQQSNGGAKPKLNSQTLFASNGARLVSGSERSSDVGSNEDGGSMHGSSASNSGTSDTTSNDSDSNSDEGPPRKKTKTWGENATSAVQAASSVSSDRSSPRAQ